VSGVIHWHGKALPFRKGETVATVLLRAGVVDFGASATGQRCSIFCGIGQCQSCLVEVKSRGVAEACLLICEEGMHLSSVGEYPLAESGTHGS